MKILELNKDCPKLALLVHPMLANANMIKDVIASRLGDDYHYLIPDLSAHGTALEYGFTEIAKEADDLHVYMQQSGISKLDFVWGASLGAAVAISLMRYVEMDFGSMVLDGTPFMKAPGFVTDIISRKMIAKHRKASRNRELSIRKMSELYGPEVGPGMADGLIDMDEESLDAILRSCGDATYPVLSASQQKSTLFIFGEKDYNAKPGQKKIKELYPEAEIKVLPGLGHCEMIGRNPDAYVEILKSHLE